MNYKELKQQAIEINKPRYDEKSGGVFIPALGIIIDINPLSESADWIEAMKMAKGTGKRLPSVDELHYIYCYKKEINAIIEEHSGTPLGSIHWSSTKTNTNYAWYVNLSSGLTSYYRYCNYVVRAVADI